MSNATWEDTFIVDYAFVWHALADACPKCKSLNARQWREGQDIYKNVLWDTFWGNIWDLNADHSLAHPNCRCQLEVLVVRAEVHPKVIGEITILVRELNQELRTFITELKGGKFER